MRYDIQKSLNYESLGGRGKHTKTITSFLAALSFVVSSTTLASTVDVGPDQEITVADSAFLIGVVTADNFPASKKILPVQWSQAGGPGTVTFGNDKESLTTARFSATGDYILRLTVDGDVSDEVAIKVISSAPNTIRVPQDHATIQQGIDAASDGDLVLVSPGTYQEKIKISKTITLASTYYTTGDASKIDETIIKNPTDNIKSLISIKLGTGLETQLVGFTLKGGGDGVKIKGRAKIVNNKWVDQESDSVDFTPTGKGLVQNNTMTGAGDDAVDADNLDVLIENNLMLGNGEGVEVRTENTMSQRVVIIRNNIIKNSEKTGLQFIDDEAGSSISDTAGLLIIDHNLITNSTHSGLAFMEDANTSDHEFIGADLLERVFLFNNTFIGNEYGVTGSANLIALNNIFADTNMAAINNVGGDSVVAHNLFWNNGTNHQGSNFGANNLPSSNPLLDANGKLQEGSPAIDKGADFFKLPSNEVVLNLPSAAYIGAAPDMGAYESDFDAGTTNLPPVATDDSGITDQGMSITVDVASNDSDPDGNLDVDSVDTDCSNGCNGAQDGTLTDNANGTVSYTPNSDFIGTDSFTYEICDTEGLCDTATVTVVVNEIDAPPLAQDDNAVTEEETTVIIDVASNDTDPNGNLDLSSVNSSNSANATLIDHDNGTVSYTPNAGFSGTDSFTYEICDTDNLCDTAMVTVFVNQASLPLPPSAQDDDAVTTEGVEVIINVASNDSDPDGNLDITSVNSSNAGNGSLTDNTDGTVSYTPNAGFTGTDQFDYQICDTGGLCDTATVTVVVNEIATGGTVEVRVSARSDDAEEEIESGEVSLNSSDLELMRDGSDDQMVGMRFTGINIPAGAHITNAYIQFKVDENKNSTTDTGEVPITIWGQATDDAPTFSSTNGDISKRELTTSSEGWAPAEWNTVGEEGLDQRTPDIKNIIQEIINRSERSNGSAIAIIMSGTGKRVAESFNGDAEGAPLLHIEYSTTAPEPRPPVANDDNAETNEGTAVVIDVASNDTDPDGNLDITSIEANGAGNGSLIVNADGTINYIPNTGFTGIDTFTYTISDTGSLFDTAEVTVVVNEVAISNPPEAHNDSAVTTEGNEVIIDVTSNDSDPDGNLDISSVNSNSAGNGSLTDNADGTVSYTPNPGFTGTDHFNYEICDTGGLCDTATVTVVVNEMVTGGVIKKDIRISAGTDDAEEITGGSKSGRVSLSSSDLEMAKDGSKVQKIGLRFTGANIPAGAVITKAYIQFKADETNAEATSLTIHGQAIDNASTFSKTDGNISSRTLTSSSTDWVPEEWVEKNALHDTSSIKDIIQEIVNIPGYSSDSAIAIIISGEGKRVAESVDGDKDGAPLLHVEYSTTVSGPLPPVANNDSAETNQDEEVIIDVASNDTDPNGDLDVSSVSSNSAGNGSLIDNSNGTVSYTPDAGFTGTDTFTYEICDLDGLCSTAIVSIDVVGISDATTIDVQVGGSNDDVEERLSSGKIKMSSSDLELGADKGRPQQIGLRFNSVGIPQGAIITNAYIQFTVDETDGEPTTLTIMGEASNNAEALDSTTGNLSSRPSTAMSTPWTPAPWAAGDDQQTSDISSVIQEIVDRQDWSGGNSLVISITGSGKRVAVAYDKKPSAAPKLHVEFQLGPNS